ncbi:ATP-binding protein [Halomonas sp. A40-4]|uniref:ATP-binding protein n=1 Tax=Halomonas sp. A40-4 TaxID=2785909 RepID=UPI003FA3A13A
MSPGFHEKLRTTLQRSWETLLKSAVFPGHKLFEGCDFKFASGILRKPLNELTSLAFVERVEDPL